VIVLVTPSSDMLVHRVALHGGCVDPGRRRLCQTRVSTALVDLPGAADVPTDADLTRTANTVRAMRPVPDPGIDQWHLDTGSLYRRLAAMTNARPMRLSRVAFVGDDDLALSALLAVDPPRHALLVDIDARVIAATEASARAVGRSSGLETLHADLWSDANAGAIQGRYGETFDLVVTDPPHGSAGFARFLDVAMTLTGYTGELHVAVPAMLGEAWTDDLLYDAQSTLVGSGFLIDRIEPGAFAYEETDVVASLVVARRLPGSPPVTVRVGWDAADFYTTEVQPDGVPLLHADGTPPAGPGHGTEPG
jgi:predicted methyltransferase